MYLLIQEMMGNIILHDKESIYIGVSQIYIQSANICTNRINVSIAYSYAL